MTWRVRSGGCLHHDCDGIPAHNGAHHLLASKQAHDKELWGELIRHAIGHPLFLRGMLEHAGMYSTSLSLPARLIKAIPSSMEVSGLRRKLAKILADYRFQVRDDDADRGAGDRGSYPPPPPRGEGGWLGRGDAMGRRDGEGRGACVRGGSSTQISLSRYPSRKKDPRYGTRFFTTTR
jgi:hypothetical protein